MHVWAADSRTAFCSCCLCSAGVYWSGCESSVLGIIVFQSPPSVHVQSFIVNMALLLGDTAPFISCLSSSSSSIFFFFFSGRACVCTCLGGWMGMMGAWDSTMCPLFTKKCNKWVFQRQTLWWRISVLWGEVLYFYHPSTYESHFFFLHINQPNDLFSFIDVSLRAICSLKCVFILIPTLHYPEFFSFTWEWPVFFNSLTHRCNNWTRCSVAQSVKSCVCELP